MFVIYLFDLVFNPQEQIAHLYLCLLVDYGQLCSFSEADVKKMS